MNNGTIQRTALLQPNQSIRTMPHAVYRVTGGYIELGFLGGGHVTKIVGIYVDNTPQVIGHAMNQMTWTQGNQPFNINFGKVIYEIRAAGQSTLSNNVLQNIRYTQWPHSAFYTTCINSYKTQKGLNTQDSFNETSVSNRLIDSIAL